MHILLIQYGLLLLCKHIFNIDFLNFSLEQFWAENYKLQLFFFEKYLFET